MVNVKINDLVAAGGVSDTMQFETDISGATSNKVTALQIKTYALTSLAHSSLSSLTVGDDHTQYAKADGTRWTTTPTASRVVVSDASGYLGVSTVNTTTLGYLDATSSVQTQLNSKFSSSSSVDHNSTTNFVANKHIDHTGVSISTTSPLTGGGDISSTRTLTFDITGLTVDASPDRANDYVLTYDASATSNKKVLLNKLVTSSDIDHNATTNYAANNHVDHTSVSVSTSTGLAGGGDISSTRTLSLDINALTEDTTPDTANDFLLTYDASATAHKKVKLNKVGGTGTGSATFIGLTDVPASFSGAGGKTVAVNSGATALEFITSPVGFASGATLPSSPTTGQIFLHTPTGRKWLMAYDGTNWNALFAFGTSTIYVTVSASGSTSWDNGYSSGTAWTFSTMSAKFPPEFSGNLNIYCAAGTYTGDNIYLNGLNAGSYHINVFGATTNLYTGKTVSSVDAARHVVTFSATVASGVGGTHWVRPNGLSAGDYTFSDPFIYAVFPVFSTSGSTLTLPATDNSLFTTYSSWDFFTLDSVFSGVKFNINGTSNVNLFNLSFSDTASVYWNGKFSNLQNISGCYFSSNNSFYATSGLSCYHFGCYFNKSAGAVPTIKFEDFNPPHLSYCWLANSTASGYCLNVNYPFSNIRSTLFTSSATTTLIQCYGGVLDFGSTASQKNYFTATGSAATYAIFSGYHSRAWNTSTGVKTNITNFAQIDASTFGLGS